MREDIRLDHRNQGPSDPDLDTEYYPNGSENQYTDIL